MPNQMSSRIQSAVVLAVVSGMSTLSLGQADIPRLVNQSKAAVVTLTTYDKSDKEISQGTGFFISPKGEIVTNHHVLEGSARAVARTSSGKLLAILTVVWDDPASDLVCLQVNTPTVFQSLKLATTEPQVGEKVLVIGNPLGLQGTVSDGIVSAIRNLPDVGKMIQITAPISPGSSGSPVLNSRGEVVGVATLNAVGGQNLNFAIPIERVKALHIVGTKSFVEWAKSQSALAKSSAAGLVAHAYVDMEVNKDFKAALGHLDDAIAADPDYEPAYLWLGSLYGRMTKVDGKNRSDESIAAFKKAIALDPTDAEAFKRLSAAYASEDNYGQSITAMLEAIRIHPEDSDSHYFLGVSYLGAKEPEKALNQFIEAIRLAPNVGSYHESAARLYAAKYEFETAIAEFKESIRLDPNDAQAHYDLGILYNQLGNREGAMQEYRTLMTLDTNMAQQLFQKLYP